MLVHRWVTLSNKFTGTQLYSWVERDIVRVKCLDQEHNSVSARARTSTARPGVKHTNHEASTPHCFCVFGFFCFIFSLYFLSVSFFSVYSDIIYSSCPANKILLDPTKENFFFVVGSRVAELEMYLLVAKVKFTINNLLDL